MNFLQAAGFDLRSPTISPQCRAACAKSRRGEQSGNWKGGRIIDRHGYVLLWKPDHPNAKGSGYVHEHRYIMSEKLGRPLTDQESVHHKNAIKDDNRPENLELMTKRVHRGIVECPHCSKSFSIR